jgi:GT2 family glycosyltransferase
MSQIAAIVIGRNEGDRLTKCLASLNHVDQIIYVDSGSTDGSVEAARQSGAIVVDLDMSRPFTAARARNAGIEELPDNVDLVQLIDGDCTLDPAWLAQAGAFLADRPDVAIVAGRLRETNRDASIYNAQCDREWDTPIGEASACGGIALVRRRALQQVGGFNPALIAGEEPEMCVRLRAKGWKIWRLDAEMALHDAAMTRYGQFWKRARRAGHAYAEGAYLHGAPPERHYVAQRRRALIWGAVIPMAILLALLVFGPVGLLALLIYPLQILRLARRNGGAREDWIEAALLTSAKFAEAIGVAEFHLRRWTGRRAGLIEYK